MRVRVMARFVTLLVLCGCAHEPPLADPAAARPDATGGEDPAGQEPTSPTPWDAGPGEGATGDEGSPLTDLGADPAPIPDGAASGGAETSTTTTFQETQRRSGSGTLVAPPAFAHLVPRTQWPVQEAYGNLIYEGSNSGMRGDADASGLYAADALEIAERWRTWARTVRGVFLLRDSLWNQQDHVGRTQPVALMLSPSWVTVAAHESALGHPPARLGIPRDPEDDEAWSALSPEALFGPFPPSETLHTWASQTLTSNDEASAFRVRATRSALIQLDTYLADLADVAEQGPEAVAARGAELICLSDRDYFTPELRRDVIIPLLVENPYPHELHDEGKSFRVSGRNVPEDLVAMTRTTVLRRRLADGDIAIERYQLSDPAALDHLVAVLRPLVPAGEPGNTVWIWVTGPVETEGKWLGEPALAYRDALEAKLRGADLNLDRVQVVTRTPDVLDAKTPPDVLASEIRSHADVGWTLRVNMRSAVLKERLGDLAAP